jgi:hypothetical protein
VLIFLVRLVVIGVLLLRLFWHIQQAFCGIGAERNVAICGLWGPEDSVAKWDPQFEFDHQYWRSLCLTASELTVSLARLALLTVWLR